VVRTLGISERQRAARRAGAGAAEPGGGLAELAKRAAVVGAGYAFDVLTPAFAGLLLATMDLPVAVVLVFQTSTY
jgi:hypothetical protein